MCWEAGNKTWSLLCCWIDLLFSISISVIIVDILFLVMTFHQCTNHVKVKFFENDPSLVIFVTVDLTNSSSWWCVDVSLIYHHTQTHVPAPHVFHYRYQTDSHRRISHCRHLGGLTLYKSLPSEKLRIFAISIVIHHTGFKSKCR